MCLDRISKISWRRLLTIMFSLFCATAAAQDSEPVDVTFDFHEPQVARLFGDRRDAREHEIAALLAGHCRDRIGFWRFQAGETERYPRLSVRMEQNSGFWYLLVNLRVRANTTGTQWRCPLLEPGEIEQYGFPGKSQWPDKVADRFTAGILEEQGGDLLKQLRLQVRLGRRTASIEGLNNRVVLSLAWDSYPELTSSWFRIIYATGDGLVTVRSQANCTPHSFPASPAFNGILVEHRTWQPMGGAEPVDIREEHLELIASSHALAFHLEQLDDTGLWQYCQDLALAD